MSFSVANHQHDSTSNRSQKKMWSTIQNQDQRHQRVHVRVNCVDAQWSVRSVQPLPPVFTGWFRTFLQTWPKKKWQSSSSATTVACARQVQTDLSFVVASLSQFHRLHSEWVNNDQCDGNQCCPGVRRSLHRPFSCHQADACASLLLLVTVHLATVPSPPGVEPAP